MTTKTLKRRYVAGCMSGIQYRKKDPTVLKGRMVFGERAYERTGKRIEYGSGNGKLSLPYIAVLFYFPNAYKVAQRNNDCVSFGTRNGANINRCCKAFRSGVPKGKLTDAATENIYRSRNSRRDAGMSPVGAAEYVCGSGGLLLRQEYPFADLTKYNSSWAKGSGNSAAVNQEASRCTVGEWAQATSPQEVKDALANDYGCGVGSDLAIKSTRNEDGMSERNRRDSWQHEMAVLACDDTPKTVKKYNEALYLIQNSWASWNSGPKRYNQPNGSVWVRESVIAYCIRNGVVIIFSNTPNFVPLDGGLPEYDYNLI